VDYHRQLERAWSELLPKLEAMNIHDTVSRAAPQEAKPTSSPPRRAGPPGGPGAAYGQSNPFEERETLGDSTLIGV
jgi:hypothetical protein